MATSHSHSNQIMFAMDNRYKCPNCQKEYTNQMLFWRFKYYSHVMQMAMKCECKRKLGLIKNEIGNIELFDVTELLKTKKSVK